MSERRQAFRPEPIEIDLGDSILFSVGPIPWEQRNDFGNEVVKQNVDIINETVRIYTDPDSGAPQLSAKMSQKFTDGGKLLALGLSEEAFPLLPKPLFHNQVVEILLAICDVNGLDQLKALIDPNLQTPMMPGGLDSGLTAGIADIQRIESGPDSSSQDSAETPSEPSPIPS